MCDQSFADQKSLHCIASKVSGSKQLGFSFPLVGSYTAFQKVYEQPIVRSQQPEATPPEREIGEMRAREVSHPLENILVVLQETHTRSSVGLCATYEYSNLVCLC